MAIKNRFGREQMLHIGVVFCVVAASALPAVAADGPPAGKAESQSDSPLSVAYREASAEYSLGNFREALAKFEQAFRIKQVPALLFNIAQCHRQLRNFEQAAATYRSFIRLDPNSSQVVLAKELLKQVEEAVQSQSRAQKAPPLDANGSDVPIPFRPPSLEVPPARPSPLAPTAPATATAPSPNVATAAAAPSVNVATTAAAPPVAVVEAKAPPMHHSSHAVAWTGGALGVAAFGVGTVFAMEAKSAQNQLGGGNDTRSSADDQISSLHRDATAGDVLFVAGAALLVGAGIAWFLGAP